MKPPQSMLAATIALASLGVNTSATSATSVVYENPIVLPKKDSGLDLCNYDGTPFTDSKGRVYQRNPETGVIRRIK